MQKTERDGPSESTRSEERAVPRRAGKRLAVVLLLVALVLALPYVIGGTSLRNALLQHLLGDSNVTVSSSAASFGWFDPLTIDNFTLENVDAGISISVKQLRAEKSWFALWRSHPDLGQVNLISPRVEILVAADAGASPDSLPQFDQWPELAVAITDGSLRVRQEGAESAIDVPQFDLAFRMEPRPTGAVLEIEPIKIAEREPLTEELFDRGLELIVPDLKDEVSLRGEYSLELTKILLSLESDQASRWHSSQIEGVITLHQVTSQLKNDITRRLVMVAAELMQLGEVPERIRLVENSQLRFRLERGRIYHESFTFALPDVSPDFSLETEGSVGLDKSLDLRASLRIPLSKLEDSELARQLSETPVVLRVTGAVEEPKVGLPPDQEWISRLDDRLLSPDLSGNERALAESIVDLIGDLVEETSETPKEISEPLREKINQR